MKGKKEERGCMRGQKEKKKKIQGDIMEEVGEEIREMDRGYHMRGKKKGEKKEALGGNMKEKGRGNKKRKKEIQGNKWEKE